MNIENVLKQVVYSKKEVDFYVPIVTNYEENKTKNKYVNTSLFHYHLFNKKDSFIEILINKSNKKIVNLNLISINDVKKNIEIDKKIHEIPCILGNPIFIVLPFFKCKSCFKLEIDDIFIFLESMYKNQYFSSLTLYLIKSKRILDIELGEITYEIRVKQL